MQEWLLSSHSFRNWTGRNRKEKTIPATRLRPNPLESKGRKQPSRDPQLTLHTRLQDSLLPGAKLVHPRLRAALRAGSALAEEGAAEDHLVGL